MKKVSDWKMRIQNKSKMCLDYRSHREMKLEEIQSLRLSKWPGKIWNTVKSSHFWLEKLSKLSGAYAVVATKNMHQNSDCNQIGCSPMQAAALRLRVSPYLFARTQCGYLYKSTYWIRTGQSGFFVFSLCRIVVSPMFALVFTS